MPPPRALSPRRIRWLLNAFPPLWFGRIRIVELDEDFHGCTVRIRHCWLTRNLDGAMFGGTIFSGFDPYYAILYWQLLAHRGIRAQAWLRSATIQYRRPVRSSLTIRFQLTGADVAEALEQLQRTGRHTCSHSLEARDEDGVVCATAVTEVYLRAAVN